MVSSTSTSAINFEIAIQKIMREDWGYLLSSLLVIYNDINLVEDVLQDAVEMALIKWRKDGLPKSTTGWIFTVAKRKAIDRLRRDQNFNSKHKDFLIEIESEEDTKEYEYAIPDERLRLIFTCCHPALDHKISVALTLQLLGGLSTDEIARAFLVKKETMAQRLVRGKRKIKQTAIPYIIPEKDVFHKRLSAVLSVIYLIFNEGYSASSGKDHIRADLSNEAIRLARILNELCPYEPEVMALLALTLLHDSRRKSRFTSDGAFVSLEDQNRTLWDQPKIKEGCSLIERALKTEKTGTYQIQAAISAVHSQSKSYASTDWQQIVLLYDELLKLMPTSVVKLNRVVAASNLLTIDETINAIDQLENEFKSYQPFYAAKAEFYLRAGNNDIAKRSYQRAIKLSGNEREKEFLLKKLKAI